MVKKVLLQVLKSWNHDGLVLQKGDRISMDARAVNAPLRLGYARRVAADEAYEYPADNQKDAFQKITIDEPEYVIPDEVKEPVVDNSTIVVEEDEPEKKVPRIESLDFIMESHRRAFEVVGIITMGDLKGWDYNRLLAIKGIGAGTVDKIMVAYSQFVDLGNYQEKRMEIDTK